MKKSQENAKKLVFPAFSAGKNFLLNQAPLLFGNRHSTQLCKKLEKTN